MGLLHDALSHWQRQAGRPIPLVLGLPAVPGWPIYVAMRCAPSYLVALSCVDDDQIV
jgi:hypothetical protein